MGLANAYNRIIREHLRVHSAWLPITNVFALGDFGVIQNGIFTREGNIADLGIAFATKHGPAAEINFASSSVTLTRIEGGVEVGAFSGSAVVDASLKIRLGRKHAMLLKAAQIRSSEIDNVLAVANALHGHPDWRWRYRFVRSTYAASNAIMYASRSSDTEVTLAGKASALEQIDLGSFSAEVSVAANRDLALDIIGKTGVIGLGLAKVKLLGGAGLLAAPTALHPAAHEGKFELFDDAEGDEDVEDDI